SEADVASYLLVLDTINFGSGWFPTLRKRPGASGYFTIAWSLADRYRAHGPWTNAELRAMRTEELADVLGQPRDHELTALFAQALRQLGAFLGERGALDLVRAAGGSAERLAELRAARRAGVTENDREHRLWTRGQAAAYRALPRHRGRTIFY